MSKLSKSQLSILTNAAARADGFACVPETLNKAAARKVGGALVARKLMRETRAKPGVPVWRRDETRAISLVITSEGRKVIAGATGVLSDVAVRLTGIEQVPPVGAVEHIAKFIASPEGSALPRIGSKQALVIGMLSAKKGATLDALVEATGWLPHTTRAAFTGLRKKGFVIARERKDGKSSIYRLAEHPVAAAA